MDTAFNLTGFDFVIIALLLFFTLRGLWVGFLRQITTLVALLVGYVIAGQYHAKFFPFLREVIENPTAVFWSSYFLLFVITYVVTMLLGKVLARVIELTVAGWFDKLLGGVLGIVKAGVLIVLLSMILSGVLAPENTMLRDCQLHPYLNQATEYFRSLIKDEGLREKLLQKKPAISEKPEQKEKAKQSSKEAVQTSSPAKAPVKNGGE